MSGKRRRKPTVMEELLLTAQLQFVNALDECRGQRRLFCPIFVCWLRF